MKLFLPGFVLLLFVASCKKGDNTIQPLLQDYAAFLKNTEWVGTLDRSGYRYAPPCAVKFYDDKVISLHALFVFIRNNAEETPDSLTGTITTIDSLPDGRTRVDAEFNIIGKQSLYITGRNKISCLSPDPAKPETFRADLFPKSGFSLDDTWSGPARSAASFDYAYPDVSSIVFLRGESNTSYRRGGQPVDYMGIVGAIPGIHLKTVYQQKGARVYMSGFNESSSILMRYFGVLLPDGVSMMVDSRSNYARLPNYFSTNDPYGPSGVTPIIRRQ